MIEQETIEQLKSDTIDMKDIGIKAIDAIIQGYKLDDVCAGFIRRTVNNYISVLEGYTKLLELTKKFLETEKKNKVA